MVGGPDIPRGSKPGRLHPRLRYGNHLEPAGMRGLDGQECRQRRAAGDDDATVLSRASRTVAKLESLYRATGEITPVVLGRVVMDLDLSGKLTLVTGSTRGIGLA